MHEHNAREECTLSSRAHAITGDRSACTAPRRPRDAAARCSRATQVCSDSPSTGRALFLAAAGITHPPAPPPNTNEAAPSALIELAPPMRVGGKAGARRNQPADD